MRRLEPKKTIEPGVGVSAKKKGYQMKTVDARGLSCPEPVILTRNALNSKESSYEILVDNPTAMENVSRYARHEGYQVQSKETNGEYTLSVTK